MIPVVVKTYPINGQENVALNTDIKICFDSKLAPVNLEDITVENLNNGELVDFYFNQYGETLAIVIQDRHAIGENLLCGLTTYQVSIKNIIKPSAPMQKAKHILKFTTTKEDPSDISTDSIQNSESSVAKFAILESTPFDGQKQASPKYIKIVFNDNIRQDSVGDPLGEKPTVFLFQGSPEIIQEYLMLKDYQEELGFATSVQQIDIKIKIQNNILLIFPVSDQDGNLFEDNSQYTLIINNISGAAHAGHPIKQAIITFWTKFSPLYIQAEEIISTPYYGLVGQNRSNNEDFIYRLIRANSLLAESIASEAETKEAISWEEDALSQCVVNFVRYKTLYDLIFDKYVTIVSSSEDKKLSDLEISYANKPTYLKSLLDDLDRRRGAAEDEIRKFGEDISPMGVCIKGSAVDEEYDFMNRAISDLEGNKSW